MRLILLFVLYLILIALGLYHHEMWRDELQAWSLVLDSPGLADVFHNIRYEGHPSLWFLLLWPVSKLTKAPEAIQFVHFGISVYVAFLVVFRSPLRFYEKAGVLFSYFLLFEYGFISRNYLIGVALLFTIAMLWQHYEKHLWLLAVLIFLLFQCNAFMVLVAAAVLFTLIVQLYRLGILFQSRALLPVLLAGLGGLVFVVSTLPPPDSSYASAWNFHIWPGLFVETLGKMTIGLLPFPNPESHFWETTVFANRILRGLLAVALIMLLLWSARRNEPLLILITVSYTLLIAFLYLKPLGGQRHYGHFLLVLIFGCWITRYAAPDNGLLRRIFAGILMVQVAAGAYAVTADYRRPFSSAKNAAAFVRDSLDPGTQVAGGFNYLASPIAGYLGQEIYFLNDGRKADYVIWKKDFWNDSTVYLHERELFRRYVRTIDPKRSNVLILSTKPGYPGELAVMQQDSERIIRINQNPYRVTCLRTFFDAIVADENYYLLTFSPLPDTPEIK